MVPIKIKQTGPKELAIQWDDNHEGRHTLQVLRKYCPCAACKQEQERGGSAMMFPILQPGQNELGSIETIGNYALQISWRDGHKTGIYTFDYLRQLCECDACMKISGE